MPFVQLPWGETRYYDAKGTQVVGYTGSDAMRAAGIDTSEDYRQGFESEPLAWDGVGPLPWGASPNGQTVRVVQPTHAPGAAHAAAAGAPTGTDSTHTHADSRLLGPPIVGHGTSVAAPLAPGPAAMLAPMSQQQTGGAAAISADLRPTLLRTGEGAIQAHSPHREQTTQIPRHVSYGMAQIGSMGTGPAGAAVPVAGALRVASYSGGPLSAHFAQRGSGVAPAGPAAARTARGLQALYGHR